MKEFKKGLITFLLQIITCITIAQSISFTTSNQSFNHASLARHYADDVLLVKKVSSDENGRNYFYFDSLNSGIYYIVLPDSSSFEFLYDNTFNGKIEITHHAPGTFQLLSAPQPTRDYYTYNQLIRQITTERDSLNFTLRQHDTNEKAKKKLLKQRQYLDEKEDSLLRAMVLNFENTFLGNYLKPFEKIQVPDFKHQENNRDISDSLIWAWRLNYYKKHFMDNLELADPYLINTPVYTNMVNRYLDKITLQQPEDLKQSISLLVKRASANRITHEFLTNYLLKKYALLKANPLYEAVYLDIIKLYYLEAEAPWADNNLINVLSREYNQLAPLMLGMKAPQISIEDMNYNIIALDSINSRFIVLYFHNYDCHYCEKVGPEIKKLSLKYDKNNLRVFAICLGEEDDDCRDYVLENGYTSFYNGINREKIASIATSYNIRYTPTIFLLNNQKKIIAKNLNVNQLKELLRDSLK
jgi:thiol-disulfide isomerase/thioredoxin